MWKKAQRTLKKSDKGGIDQVKMQHTRSEKMINKWSITTYKTPDIAVLDELTRKLEGLPNRKKT